MLLVADVGNTNIVFGLYFGVHLKHVFRVESARGKSSDEYAVLLLQLLEMAGVTVDQVKSAIVASVVPPLTQPIVDLIARVFSIETIVVGAPGVHTGMPILIENPRELGADRICNAVAAFEKVKGAVISVDFGTATNFDVASPKGEYLGGVLAPGVQISADALFSRAAKLPRVEIAKPAKVLGRSTVTAMQSGIVFGYVGLVDGLVARLQAELGYACHVIATGGLARVIAPLSSTIKEVDDSLTLEGLRILHERNTD